MLIFGIHPVFEALRAPRIRVLKIFADERRKDQRIQELLQTARSRKIPVVKETAEGLTRRTGQSDHQSVAAEIQEPVTVSLEQALESFPSRILLLDGVEDPRNLGAVLRTAEATGVSSVLLPRRHSCGITPIVIKTSAGGGLHLKIAQIGNVNQTLGKLKEAGYWVVGLDMEGEESPPVDPDLNLVLVVGGENRGLRRLVRENCDFLLRLPMRGQISSLNLSVAAGVLLYRFLRE